MLGQVVVLEVCHLFERHVADVTPKFFGVASPGVSDERDLGEEPGAALGAEEVLDVGVNVVDVAVEDGQLPERLAALLAAEQRRRIRFLRLRFRPNFSRFGPNFFGSRFGFGKLSFV